MRTQQLEALMIDQEIKNIFLDWINQITTKYHSEVKLLLDYIWYRFTIAVDKPLPGQSIQNIKFSNQNKLLYLLVFVLGKYGLSKLSNYIDGRENDSKKKTFKGLMMFYRAARFLYFIVFLSQKSLVHNLELYLIGFQVEQIQPNQTRELDFELLNRTIIWEVINKIFQQILSGGGYVVKQLKQMIFMTSFLGSIQNQGQEGCFVCQEEIMTLPITLSPCQHQFCYYQMPKMFINS
ncbi:peroxisome assembly protein (Peroxin-2) [Paramecium bursaria]